MPVKNLNQLATMTFADEAIESPLQFDSHLDFWEYYYEEKVKNHAAVEFWHVPKDEPIYAPPSEKVVIQEYKKLEERRAEAVKRRNRRLFLAQEHQAYFRAQRFEEHKQKPIVVPDLDENEVEEDADSRVEGDFFLEQRWPSEMELVEMLRPESPTEGMGVEKKDVLDAEIVARLREESTKALEAEVAERRARIRSAALSAREERRREMMASLRPPTKLATPKLSSAELEARRAAVRKRMQGQGAALPVTMLKAESEGDDKVPIATRRQSMKPQTSKTPVKYTIPAGRVRGKAPEDVPVKKEETVRQFIEQDEPDEVFQEMPLPADIVQPEPPPPQQDVAPAAPVPPEEETPPRPPKKQRRLVKAKPSKAEPKTRPPPKEKEKPQPPKKIIVEHERLLPHVVSIPNLEPPKAKPKPATPKSTSPPPPEKPNGVSIHPPSVAPPPKQPLFAAYHLPIPVASIKDSEELSVTDSDDVSTEEEFIPEEEVPGFDGPDVHDDEAAALAWNLIRLRRFDDDMPAELRRLLGVFWFPGLKGKPATLTNIVAVLLELLRNGLWSEKCEASKALLMLYRTFQGDFLDPLTTLIRPQLEILDDENWQVLKHVAEGHHIRKLKFIQQKHIEHVREREMYRQEMFQLIFEWLKSLDEAYFSNLHRTDSYYQHLAGKFFPPDKGGFKLPRPSLEVVKAMGRVMKRKGSTAGNGRVIRRGAIFMTDEEEEESEKGITKGFGRRVSGGRRASAMSLGRRGSLFPTSTKAINQSDQQVDNGYGEEGLISDSDSVDGWDVRSRPNSRQLKQSPPISVMSGLPSLMIPFRKHSPITGAVNSSTVAFSSRLGDHESPAIYDFRRAAASPSPVPLTPAAIAARLSGDNPRPVSAIPYSHKRLIPSILESLKAQTRPFTAYHRRHSAGSRQHIGRGPFRRLDSGRSAFRDGDDFRPVSADKSDGTPRPNSGPWSMGWKMSPEVKVSVVAHDKPFRP
ncbi:hypothetical protein HK097_011211 [Rhizophlyctis rosea]|uniref:Uncharacterized protein n=1 Tax=Rhizophlyctis rosea TaxID=64517 RepID=A0AAD5SNZ7_9FUNG|nr:hypothetical protein HK097_011211 [Rhizophlyctis rosea]